MILFARNLKRAISGTLVGGEAALNVVVANEAAAPLPVASAELAMKDYRHMNFETAPAAAGVWTELGDAPGVLSAAAVKLKAANNSGSALLLGVGPDASSVVLLAAVHAGQTGEAVFGATLVLGDRLWVKPILAVDADAGALLVTTF